ncbi:hypothetical protein Hanom_Chr09g00846971 [Helianthus anomalus]
MSLNFPARVAGEMVATAVRFQVMVAGHDRGCRKGSHQPPPHHRLPPLHNYHQPPPTPPSSDQPPRTTVFHHRPTTAFRRCCRFCGRPPPKVMVGSLYRCLGPPASRAATAVGWPAITVETEGVFRQVVVVRNREDERGDEWYWEVAGFCGSR